MGIKTVIADDESILRLYLALTLPAFGFDVVSQAQDGKDVIEAVREHNPDVVFLDINMATEEDGLDCCDEINRTNPSVKVIFLSAYPETAFCARLSSMNYAGYLEKPVNKEKLRQYLKVFLVGEVSEQ